MEQKTEYNRGRDVVFSLHAHLVFVTKFRRPCFTEEQLQFLEQTFRNVCESFGAALQECSGEGDHVHLLVSYPPKVALSVLTNSLKGVSSRLLTKTFGKLHPWYWKGTVWSPSYFAVSCGGAPIEASQKYIQHQGRPAPA